MDELEVLKEKIIKKISDELDGVCEVEKLKMLTEILVLILQQ